MQSKPLHTSTSDHALCRLATGATLQEWDAYDVMVERYLSAQESQWEMESNSLSSPYVDSDGHIDPDTV